MIKNILKIIPNYRNCILKAYFCQKSQTLKTYLQVIPPHKIYELREKKQHRLQNALINIQKATDIKEWKQQDIKTIFKQVKKRTNMIPVQTLNRIIEISCANVDNPYNIQLRQIYSKIIRTAKEKAQKLPLEDLIQMVYRLVKHNKKEYQLMKEVEKVIIEDRVKIDFPLIRKILYSYTHLNAGSAVLYSHISKTIAIGQYELRPIELAEAAYMLSKVSQNAKGGYGVFSLAEKHLEASLPRMSFSQLVKASSFMLTQDLGSNKFQMKLEQSLYNTYPAKDRLKITEFVQLLKATSGYFFKFKQNALLSMLKTSTIRMSKYATVQQFEDILWSWGRLGKGDKQVWDCLEIEVKRHLSYLKPRQVAFFYYSLCSTNFSSPQLLKRLEDQFIALPLESINQHYLIKFLLGMHKKKLFQNEKFIKISQIISKRIETLSNNQFLTFLKILNESDIDFSNKSKISSVIESLQRIIKKLQSKLYVLKITEIAQLLFLFVKLEINDENLIQKCFSNLSIVINIPKSSFIKAFFSFTMKQRYDKALQFIPIAEELSKYGPIGYFFSPYQFPLLGYCLFHLAVNGENISISKQLLYQTQITIKQINPIILNEFVKKGYEECLKLINKYNDIAE